MKLLSRVYLRVPSVVLLALLAMAVSAKAVRADVPGGTPTFTNPLNIDNQFFPFQPGGLKVFAGSDHGTKTAAIDRYLTATRTFKLNGKNVGLPHPG